MEKITSMKNPSAKLLRSLKDKTAREETGLFLVEGQKMIQEALNSGLALHTLLAEASCESFARKFAPENRCFLAARSILESVCDTRTPQGVCAAFSMPAPLDLSLISGSIVALDGVQDPGNVGTIWRTADAAGLSALVLGPGCADPLSPKVQRAAMGSGFRVPFLSTENLPDALAHLQKKGYVVVASALDGTDFYAAPRPGKAFALIVGNEARGISAEVRSVANLSVRLPMRGGAESLNAAVAAGILMYALTEPCD